MSKSIYIINPKCDFPNYYTADVCAANDLTPAILVADLAIVTLAAMAPDDFTVRICDEYVEDADLSARPDFVLITGKVSQWGRMKRLAATFRQAGVMVIIGGPHASLSPDAVRPHADILVRGEIEEIYAGIFEDLRNGTWKAEYIGGKPDMRLAPVPRWDLYPNDNAFMGSVQTSRGCPFECEFCDVIEYLGRKQRHKPVQMVLAELDILYKHGYRAAFLADDNFTVYRARAREMLVALQEWNARRTDGRMRFVTQVSIDAAGDVELLRMCADAGLSQVFIGIETPNEESLRSAKKRQNLKRDLAQEIRTFVENGIAVDGGMIVGFDEDHSDIFMRQYEFAMSVPVPVFSLGALVAPFATRLHARLTKEKRLVENVGEMAEIAASPWTTNIEPLHMSRQELFDGIRWLCNSLYRADAFGTRLFDFMDSFGTAHRPEMAGGGTRPIDYDTLDLVSRLSDLGDDEARLVSGAFRRLKTKPEITALTIAALVRYAQIRHMYDQGDFWVPEISNSLLAMSA
jgi:hypothetical protein